MERHGWMRRYTPDSPRHRHRPRRTAEQETPAPTPTKEERDKAIANALNRGVLAARQEGGEALQKNTGEQVPQEQLKKDTDTVK